MAREDRQRRRERRHGRDNPEQGNNPNPNTNNPRETALPAAPGATPIHDPSHPNNHNPNNPNIPASSSIASISQYTEDDGLSSYYDRELSELQNLCDAASESDPTSWDKIRLWLRNHSAEDARAAAERRGDYETTPLHLACRNCPPLDIVNMLLTASPRTVELADSFGWLPLHYACANEASEDVLVMLAEQYPTSKTSVDKRKRTPLHFALGHTERPANVATVVLLSGTGAALMADENGMLPLHYACAYGATEQALRVLTDENIQTITATDNRGRTPLHFALGNADRPASPGVVGLLLSQNPAVVNSVDLDGQLPIHLLATQASRIKENEREKCANCQACFSLYLNANPSATADLLTALQSLPDWLRDSAVLSPVVQKILNIKISQRFPTAVTLADFVFYVMVIAFFQLAVISSVEARNPVEQDDGSLKPRYMNMAYLVPLYIAVVYFSAREITQAMSLASLGLFRTWLSDFENWLDVIYIFLILFWSIVMTVLHDDGLTDAYQTGAAISMAVFWIMVLIFLQSIIVGFAVFVGGVIYVVKRLAAFLVALVIILIAFAQIFFTLFRQSDDCQYQQNATAYIKDPVMVWNCTDDATTGVQLQPCPLVVESCEPEIEYPFCSFWHSFLKVFTMLLGEVDEEYFSDNVLATLFYALFMFACVIVLANVLIAIVTDSYGVIQNERAALVFWSNRLDFVAEMDVISNNFCRKGRGEARVFEAEDSIMGELWKKVMYLFDDDIDEHGVMSVEFIIYNICRVCVACIIIPLWIIIGFVTFGLLWPPQVREKLLTSSMTSRTEKASAERTRLNQVSILKEDVSSFQEEMKADMEKGRDEMDMIKAVLGITKTDIHTEMNDVKTIVTELFELLSAP
mmetsp:Transcript_7043/g.12336  ORF Transcript_7043/g.12336 Transcript_7043/m.12336 type:complete len:867 (+) Transcript_7043:91-2691(+)|eukprot:CAMPEP_0201881366 /NCGR_PEP_ID=MMETSP0902-20130614/11687_1 /ASSEMBLY_ACC=CAM_ASM_000551 /TAXON_ID=420261 /ORGANISM="Thalassiosira antarctica, Strain CCMP982" /LENGTH=866 /DNA_ID=CAMNT_0048409551 /DNA_START=83 /DNA_END=2683 /DNA_ORIENTATION=+